MVVRNKYWFPESNNNFFNKLLEKFEELFNEKSKKILHKNLIYAILDKSCRNSVSPDLGFTFFLRKRGVYIYEKIRFRKGKN